MSTETMSLLDAQINYSYLKGDPGVLVSVGQDGEDGLNFHFKLFNGVSTQDEALELFELAAEVLKSNGAQSSLKLNELDEEEDAK